MWQPKSVVAIPIVTPCLIKLIDELMEDVTETKLLAPAVSIEPTIDVVNNLVVS